MVGFLQSRNERVVVRALIIVRYQWRRHQSFLKFACNQMFYFFYFSSPSGWDNEKKIAILHENLSTVRPEDPFEDFITKPPVRKVRLCRNVSVWLYCQKCCFISFCVFFLAGSWEGDQCRRWAGVPDEAAGPWLIYLFFKRVWNVKCLFTRIYSIVVSSKTSVITHLLLYILFFLQSLLAKQPVTPARGAAVSHLALLKEDGDVTYFYTLLIYVRGCM